jgi:SAM-dependent methyltransferase
MQNKNSTSWEKVKDWYDGIVGAEGQYYHRQIIFPNLLKLWQLKEVTRPSILDLACGQGVLARYLSAGIPYLGIDISPSLIKIARQQTKSREQQFGVGDITKSLPKIGTDFSHAAIILALQNLEKPAAALKNAAHHLRKGGILTLVINHPAFRIPRQSSWGVDENKKLQYRRIDCYMTPMKVPIQIHPGNPTEPKEMHSYHWPLNELSSWLQQAGFAILTIDEWCSDKQSVGSKAKMENRARNEFPLFMAIQAIKL